MISPQGQNETYVRDVGRQGERSWAGTRTSTTTSWWLLALFGVMALGCVGFAGALQSAGEVCQDVGRRACLSLVIDDLTGEPVPHVRGRGD
jgi:hypothetical protein